MFQAPKIVEMPVGVVMRRSPGVTRWIAHVWTLAGIVPRAPAADWRMTRTDGDVIEYHAATLTLQLHRKDTDSLVQNLTSQVPSVWVGLRGGGRPDPVLVTASPFEASFHEIRSSNAAATSIGRAMRRMASAMRASFNPPTSGVRRNR